MEKDMEGWAIRIRAPMPPADERHKAGLARRGGTDSSQWLAYMEQWNKAMREYFSLRLFRQPGKEPAYEYAGRYPVREPVGVMIEAHPPQGRDAWARICAWPWRALCSGRAGAGGIIASRGLITNLDAVRCKPGPDGIGHLEILIYPTDVEKGNADM